MRNLTLLGTRLVLGGYLAAHGAQKLFGSFDGPGPDAAGAGFEQMGLTPGKQMAQLAGASELGGGILTITGAASPIGPVAILGSMAVATAVHRKAGPFAMKGGFELPLTNAAAAALLAVSGPGVFRLPIRLPKWMTTFAVLGGFGLAGFSLMKLLRAKPTESTPETTADPVPSEDDAANA